jgi:hypothetical protein
VLLDYSVYPDLEQLPDTLDSPEQKADYLARVCGAWDFGIVPTAETFALFQDWETIFEQFPRRSSPAYAAFRAYFGWSCLPGEPILQANYERLDRRGIRPDCWIDQAWPVRLDPNAMNTPHIPSTLDPIAVELLTRLRAHAECAAIVLGGHFALKHYVDYRTTHDIDAWWDIQTSPTTQKQALARVEAAMAEIALLRNAESIKRSTRMVDFLDLRQADKTIFSFQIAEREHQLEAPLNVPWSPIQIETLNDNVGEKMNALVGRGAPRDFLDIRAVVDHRLMSVEDVWTLWQQKNPDLDLRAAKAEVLRHLQSIELRRPIASLPPEQQLPVQQSRQWFRQELLGLRQ